MTAMVQFLFKFATILFDKTATDKLYQSSTRR